MISKSSVITTLFIDLDDTLYPASSGVWSLIRQRIDRYMVERLNYPPDQVAAIRASLFQTYGTTMRGLQAIHQIDEADFLAFVHDVPVHEHLTPDHRLREVLSAYPQQKIILTNADTRHAQRVIQALELENLFQQIIDIRAIAPFCKPQEGAFTTALRLAHESDPAYCLVIDDAPRNLLAARQLGFHVALVAEPPVRPEPGFPAITRLSDLPAIFPCDHLERP